MAVFGFEEILALPLEVDGTGDVWDVGDFIGDDVVALGCRFFGIMLRLFMKPVNWSGISAKTSCANFTLARRLVMSLHHVNA